MKIKIDYKKYRYIINSFATIVFIGVFILTLKFYLGVIMNCLKNFTLPFGIIAINYSIISLMGIIMIIKMIANFKKFKG